MSVHIASAPQGNRHRPAFSGPIGPTSSGLFSIRRLVFSRPSRHPCYARHHEGSNVQRSPAPTHRTSYVCRGALLALFFYSSSSPSPRAQSLSQRLPSGALCPTLTSSCAVSSASITATTPAKTGQEDPRKARPFLQLLPRRASPEVRPNELLRVAHCTDHTFTSPQVACYMLFHIFSPHIVSLLPLSFSYSLWKTALCR